MTRSKGLFAIRSGYRTSFLYLLEGKQRSGKRKQPKDYHTVYQTLVAPYDNTANNTWLVFTGDFAVATNILKKKRNTSLTECELVAGQAARGFLLYYLPNQYSSTAREVKNTFVGRWLTVCSSFSLSFVFLAPGSHPLEWSVSHQKRTMT